MPLAEQVYALSHNNYRIVGTVAERDAIPAEERKLMLKVGVISTSATYRLDGGITNLDWVVDTSGSSGITSHGGLTGLLVDDHSQYALLAGRLGDIYSVDEVKEFTLDAGFKISSKILATAIDGTGTGTSILYYNRTTGEITYADSPSGVSPLTTKGDIYIYSAGDDRLGIGGNGQVLSADSTEPKGMKWITMAGGGSVNTVTATLPLTSTEGTDPVIALTYDNTVFELNPSSELDIKSGVFAPDDTYYIIGTSNMDNISDSATYVKTQNNFTDALLSKLNAITAGADLYSSWTLHDDGGLADTITSGETLTITGSAYIDAVWAANVLTITYTGGVGTVTDVAATLPLSSTGGSTPNISLAYEPLQFELDPQNELSLIFGTGGGVAAEGNHTHTGTYQPVGSYFTFGTHTMDDIGDGITYVKTANDFTDLLKTKLDGIADSADAYNHWKLRTDNTFRENIESGQPLDIRAGANVTVTYGGAGGIVTIAASGGSGVTSVGGTAPIVSTGGTDPVISLTYSSTYFELLTGTTLNIKASSISADRLVDTYSLSTHTHATYAPSTHVGAVGIAEHGKATGADAGFLTTLSGNDTDYLGGNNTFIAMPAYILATGVTYANLNTNGDVGTGSTQVSRGDHTHATYITSTGVTYANLNTNGDVGTGSTQVSRGDHTHVGYLANIVQDVTPQLGGDLDLNQKSVVIDSTPTTNDTGQGLSVSLSSNSVTLSKGILVYITSGGFVAAADADATTTMPVIGMLIDDLNAGNSYTGRVLVHGVYRDDAWAFTAGTILFASTTAGGIMVVAPSGTGDQVQPIGVALSADVILVAPNLTVVEVV